MKGKLAKLFVNRLHQFLGARKPSWLAKESGLAQSSVGRILSGETEPSFDSVEAIAHALKLHPIEFFIEDGATHSIKRKVSLEEDQMQAIKSILRSVQEEHQAENPESAALAAHLPKDIQQALIEYEDDWNLLRAALDIPEIKRARKGKEDAG